jgi:hypothetical protein
MHHIQGHQQIIHLVCGYPLWVFQAPPLSGGHGFLDILAKYPTDSRSDHGKLK